MRTTRLKMAEIKLCETCGLLWGRKGMEETRFVQIELFNLHNGHAMLVEDIICNEIRDNFFRRLDDCIIIGWWG